MNINSGPFNDYALNDPSSETSLFDLAAETTIEATAANYQHVRFDLALEGAVLSTSTPRQTVNFGLALEMKPELLYRRDRVLFDWAADLTPRSLTLPKQRIFFDWALEQRGQQLISPFVGTEFGIAASAALGVLPQQGSAIYTKWAERGIKEVRVNRHADRREQSGLDEAATRKAWDLEVEIHSNLVAAHWTFIKDHFGLGKPFYFYDLENNGFVYDATGVVTTGRYLCRFQEETFPQIYKVGSRFRLSYSVIEVE